MENILDEAGIHLMVGFQGYQFEEELKRIVEEFRIGGIVLFRRNIDTPEQVHNLLLNAQKFALEILGRPLLVAIDQEGGPVQRLLPPFTQLPSAREVGAGGADSVVRWQTVAAREMRELGIHANFAPVLDVVSAGENHFMTARSLGDEPKRVAELGAVWIRTLQGNGISATAKHFPGLGRAEEDPHHYAPVIHWRDRQAMERDLFPFEEAARSGVHCVMTSHALYPFLDNDFPATLSQRINRRLLRESLGFKGVLFSDDMDMAAVAEKYSWDDMVRLGFRSTIDFFLTCQHSSNIEPFHRAIQDALSGNTALRDAHFESVRRIRRLLEFHWGESNRPSSIAHPFRNG